MSTPHASQPAQSTAQPPLSPASRIWGVLIVYSAVVCVLHFGGLAYDVYTTLWWWDLLTHSLSGVGVAAWLCLLRPVPLDSTELLLVPLVVLAIGAGFEVYEYLFKSFYVEWSLQYYVADTAIDLFLDALGAAALVQGVERWPGDLSALGGTSAEASRDAGRS